MKDDELRRLFEETGRHFDVAERLERRIAAVAESVTVLDEKVDRRIDDMEQRMDQGFAETQAMNKFWYAELDRRVRALEQVYVRSAIPQDCCNLLLRAGDGRGHANFAGQTPNQPGNRGDTT